MTITVTPKFVAAADFGFGSVTFAGLTLGAGDYIFMVFDAIQSAGGSGTAAPVLDGITATQVGTGSLEAGSAPQNTFWKITGIANSTGTMTISGAHSGVSVCGWLVSGADFSTAATTWQAAGAIADPQEVIVTVPSGGVVFAGIGFSNFGTTGLPVTWSGVTRDSALEAEEFTGNGGSIAGAHSTSASGSTTIDFSSSNGDTNFSGGLLGSLTMSAASGGAAFVPYNPWPQAAPILAQ